MLCASRVAGSLTAIAALLPVVAVPTAGAAVSDLIPRGATVLSVDPVNVNLDFELRGAVCQSNTCTTVVRYVPFNTASGVAALDTALASPPAGNIIVFGYSHGAEVAAQWLAQHPSGPPSSQVLSFVLIGN